MHRSVMRHRVISNRENTEEGSARSVRKEGRSHATERLQADVLVPRGFTASDEQLLGPPSLPLVGCALLRRGGAKGLSPVEWEPQESSCSPREDIGEQGGFAVWGKKCAGECIHSNGAYPQERGEPAKLDPA